MRVRISGAAILLVGAVLAMLLVAAAPTAAAGDQAAIIRGVPAYKQQRSLSCEYAAAYVVTKFWGKPITENVFIREVPLHPNPHKGYRGNINGPVGGITHYGVYAEPLVPVLEARGYDATVFYGGVERLKANLRAGNPTVVWLTSGRNAVRPIYWRMFEGESFKLVPWEHAVVAYGYDSYGIQMMDVGDGNYYHTDWSSFLRRWGYFDQMSLVIRPLSSSN
jgi:uncharacterized protein YvpB